MNLFRCTRCLYPSTKPDLHFDAAGLCSACQAFDRRKEIDWTKRQQDFLTLIHENRGASHDVIVACSGGKDSTWQILKCLELGLRPLAVTATTDHLSAIGRRNLDNISNLCDHIEITPHKPTRRKISRFALEEVGDISWCEHHLIWSVPAREAISRETTIVLYGECPQNEYGAGPAGTEQAQQLTKSWMDEFGGLLGLRLSDLSEILEIDPRHLELYRYPPEHEKVKAIFMGAYFEWDGFRNAQIAREHGFEWSTMPVEGNGSRYENLDNLTTGTHDLARYWKFGYTRAVDIASNHIRRGRMTREEGIAFCNPWEGKVPLTYLGIPTEKILSELDLTMDDLKIVAERFANRELFEIKDGWPKPKFGFESVPIAYLEAANAGDADNPSSPLGRLRVCEGETIQSRKANRVN